MMNAVIKVVGSLKQRNNILIIRSEQHLQENNALLKNAAKLHCKELLASKEVEGNASVAVDPIGKCYRI